MSECKYPRGKLTFTVECAPCHTSIFIFFLQSCWHCDDCLWPVFPLGAVFCRSLLSVSCSSEAACYSTPRKEVKTRLQSEKWSDTPPTLVPYWLRSGRGVIFLRLSWDFRKAHSARFWSCCNHFFFEDLRLPFLVIFKRHSCQYWPERDSPS